MTKEQIRDKLILMIRAKWNIDPAKEISEQSSFTKDLGADSLEQAELLMDIEDEFGVSVPTEAESEIKTVGDAAAKIEALLKDEETA